jgi:hypothetical protein
MMGRVFGAVVGTPLDRFQFDLTLRKALGGCRGAPESLRFGRCGGTADTNDEIFQGQVKVKPV